MENAIRQLHLRRFSFLAHVEFAQGLQNLHERARSRYRNAPLRRKTLHPRGQPARNRERAYILNQKRRTVIHHDTSGINASLGKHDGDEPSKCFRKLKHRRDGRTYMSKTITILKMLNKRLKGGKLRYCAHGTAATQHPLCGCDRIGGVAKSAASVACTRYDPFFRELPQNPIPIRLSTYTIKLDPCTRTP